MNYLRAFRHNLRQLRTCRRLRDEQLESRVRAGYFVDLVFVSQTDCGFVVFTRSPRCGWVRIISRWKELSPAILSMHRMLQRKKRERVRV